MPRESFDIKLFNKGLVSSVDAEDIPVDSASYSENIDGDAVEGRLQGIPAYTTKFSDKGLYVGKSAWVRRDTGEYDLIYDDRNGANIKAISDFYGSGVAESTPISSFNAKSIVVQNKGAHIGTGSTSAYPPKFIGRLSWNQFGGIGKNTFTGAGSSNIYVYGNYTGTIDKTVRVTIIDDGGIYFTWKYIGGSDSARELVVRYTEFTLADGLKLMFTDAVAGYFDTDKCEVPVYAISSSLAVGNAEVTTDVTHGLASSPRIKLTNTGTGGTVIPANIYRRYKYTIIYDGVQESLLSEDNSNNNFLDTVGHDTVIVSVYIIDGKLRMIDQRITSVNVYCAISEDNTEEKLGLYRYIGNIPIANTEVDMVAGTGAFSPDSGFKASSSEVPNVNGNDVVGYVVDTSLFGATYEANTGIPQNADTNIVNYELNTQVSGYLFAGKCYSQYLPDAKLTIFRSKELRYDMFDIVNDKIQLNILPTAMAGFNGKLYVWDLNTTIIINPQGLYIENIIHGKGCASQTSWAVIDIQGEHILTFCDANNVYATDGAGISDIGDAIKKSSSGVSWQGLTHSSVDPIVIFDATRNTVFYISKYSSYSVAYGYHIVRKRWDFYPIFVGNYTCQGAFAGKNGETYSSNSVALLTNFNGASNRDMSWESQSLTFNSPSQYKEFTYMYQDKIQTSGVITALYSADAGSYTALTNTTQIKDGTGKFVRAKIFKFKIYTTSSGVHYLNSLSILVRRMVGAR